MACDSLGRKSQVCGDNGTMSREAAAGVGPSFNTARPVATPSVLRHFSWDLRPRLSPSVASRLKIVGKGPSKSCSKYTAVRVRRRSIPVLWER